MNMLSFIMSMRTDVTAFFAEMTAYAAFYTQSFPCAAERKPLWLAGLPPGITYAAHALTDTSTPAALELETLGGHYLLASPNVFATRAARYHPAL